MEVLLLVDIGDVGVLLLLYEKEVSQIGRTQLQKSLQLLPIRTSTQILQYVPIVLFRSLDTRTDEAPYQLAQLVKFFTANDITGSDAATGRGTGTSKKDAEQNAARDAAERLNLLASESE